MTPDRRERTLGDTGMLSTSAGGALVLRRVRLEVIEGPDAGIALEIDGGTRIVGTAPGTDLRLTDPRVSRQHLEVALLPRGVSIRDLESRNGTFVADAIVQRVVLPGGGLVRLGKTTVLRIVAADVPVSPPPRTRLGELVAASPAMTRILGTLARVAASDLPLLLEGEAGVGKTAAARAVHQESGRGGELVVVDLGADGARDELRAAVAAAKGGTLLLERADRAAATLQAALVVELDALERDTGGAGARVIATAREDVRALVEQGAFARDLYFHVGALHLTIPPLRDRPEDAPVLVEAMRERWGAEPGSRELEQLRRDGFPGNVRGLRAGLGVEGTPAAVVTAPAAPRAPAGPLPAYKEAREQVVGRFERDYLERLLAEHQGNVSRAARGAGMARSHLIELLKKHGLDRPGE